MQRFVTLKRFMRSVSVIYHDVDGPSRRSRGALRRVSHRTNRAVEKDQAEDSYLWKRPRGIETTRSRARPRKGALPFRAQHAPVALGADESGNLGFCIVSIPQYRSASTSRAVARSREVDAASSHTAPGDVVAPWPDATTRALRRAAVRWHARDSRCRSAPPSPARRRALSVRL